MTGEVLRCCERRGVRDVLELAVGAEPGTEVEDGTDHPQDDDHEQDDHDDGLPALGAPRRHSTRSVVELEMSPVVTGSPNSRLVYGYVAVTVTSSPFSHDDVTATSRSA